MPHVTEEIWSFMPAERGLLAVADWPTAEPGRIDEDAEAVVGRAIQAITDLRRYREQAEVKPSAVLPARLTADGYENTAALVARLARLDLAGGDGAAPAAEVPVPGGVVQLLPDDAFDPDAAARRIAARREQLGGEIERLERKLANEKFVERAPAAVVDGEREKLAGARQALASLEGS